MRCWNWSNNGDGKGELTIYGPIASEKWWAEDVTLTDFYREMQTLGNVDEITVRINSPGGDVFAAFGMYTLIKDCGKKTVAKIDGWAASAASIVAMACDETLITEAGMFMIHDPSGGMGYTTAKGHRKSADVLDKVKEAIIDAYMKKTGKTHDEIWSLMENETYMTGKEAVSAGFCDGLMDGEVSAAVTNKGIVLVNQIDMGRLPVGMINKAKSAEERRAGKEKNMDITTAAQLEEAYPELVKEIRAGAANAATAAERERIRAIENAAVGGFEEIVNDAKFDNPVTAGEMALKICAEQKRQGASFTKARSGEIGGSGADDVDNEAQRQSDEGNKYLAAAAKIFGKEGK